MHQSMAKTLRPVVLLGKAELCSMFILHVFAVYTLKLFLQSFCSHPQAMHGCGNLFHLLMTSFMEHLHWQCRYKVFCYRSYYRHTKLFVPNSIYYRLPPLHQYWLRLAPDNCWIKATQRWIAYYFYQQIYCPLLYCLVRKTQSYAVLLLILIIAVEVQDTFDGLFPSV